MTLRDDRELLAAIAHVWGLADPPPADLADGVLARIAAEDLEHELLTLVESEGLAGVRTSQEHESGTWALEYAGPDFRLHLHRTRLEDGVRLDGWIVPARSMTVELRPEAASDVQTAEADGFGRFSFAEVGEGAHRLGLRANEAGAVRLTPPFWI